MIEPLAIAHHQYCGNRCHGKQGSYQYSDPILLHRRWWWICGAVRAASAALRFEVASATSAVYTYLAHQRVQVETRLLDNDGSILSTRERSTALIPANTTWRYYLREDQNIEIDSINETEHTVVDQTAGLESTVIEGAEVLNSSFSYDGNGVDITGEIDIGDADVSRVSIYISIFDTEGQFRGAIVERETDPNATDTIALDAGQFGFRTPRSRPVPDDYTIQVFDSSI